MDSARESWALLVTGRLVNTLLVNQITKENILKGIWLQRKKKTLGRDKDVWENIRSLFMSTCSTTNAEISTEKNPSVSVTVPGLRASSPLRVGSERANEGRSPPPLALASPSREALAWLLATPLKELAQSLTVLSLNKQTHSLCFHYSYITIVCVFTIANSRDRQKTVTIQN